LFFSHFKILESLYYIVLFPFLKGATQLNYFTELLVELSNKRQGTFYHEIPRHVKTINKKNINRIKIHNLKNLAIH